MHTVLVCWARRDGERCLISIFSSPRIIYMATLGKAAGVFGAFVAAQPEIIETLIQHARSYIYTTAAPPLLSHALIEKPGADRRGRMAA